MSFATDLCWLSPLLTIPILGFAWWSMRCRMVRHRRAELALEASDREHRELFNKCGDGLVLYDGETGAVLEVNETFEQLIGATKSEIVSCGLGVLCAESPEAAPKLQEELNSVVRRACEAGRLEFERPHRRKDGSRLVCSVTMSRMEWRGLPRVLATVRDVTARHDVEAALMESQERFRALAAASQEGLLFHRHGVITEVNERICEMFGWTRTELIGVNGVDLLIASESRPAALRRMRERSTGVYEIVALRRTGDRFPCEVFSREDRGPNGATRVVALRDVTARKATEAVMRAQVALLEATLEATGDGVLVVDRQGAVVNHNPKFVEMWRIPAELIASKSDSRLLDYVQRQLEDPEGFLKKVRELYATPAVSSNDILLLKDGRVFERHSRPQIVDGEMVGRVWSFHDATPLVSAQRELRELNAKLEQRVRERTTDLERANRTLSETNAELESFSYSVSHDLRTPLRGIDGISLALAEEYSEKLDETGGDYVRRIRVGVQRMGRIMDDITHLSRVNRVTIRYETVDLSELAHEVMHGLRAGHHQRDVEFICMDGATVCGDRRLLRILLENLLGNAWKYTTPREQAVIEFGFTDIDEETREFYVKDNGVGFDPKYTDKLFTSFMRLHSPHEFEGSGLGLAIVARIMRRLGGTVSGEGEVGRGAIFRFRLHPTCETGEYV